MGSSFKIKTVFVREMEETAQFISWARPWIWIDN